MERQGFQALLARTGDLDLVVAGQVQGVAARGMDARHHPVAPFPLVLVVGRAAGAGRLPGDGRADFDRTDEALDPVEQRGGAPDRILFVGIAQAGLDGRKPRVATGRLDGLAEPRVADPRQGVQQRFRRPERRVARHRPLDLRAAQGLDRLFVLDSKVIH